MLGRGGQTFLFHLKMLEKCSSLISAIWTGSPIVLKAFMKDGIYSLVDPESIFKFDNMRFNCWTQCPTTFDAIMWWHNVKGQPGTVPTNDPVAQDCFNQLKRIIIQFLLMCKNTSEMERGFSILHTNHSKTNPNQYLSSSRNSVLLRQFAKNFNLFHGTEMGLELARKGQKLSLIFFINHDHFLILFKVFK